MPIPMPASAVLDRYFLEMRGKVLEVAAALDRVERAAGAEQAVRDERLDLLKEAIATLTDGRADRASRVLTIFSDPYEPSWPRPTKNRR